MEKVVKSGIENKSRSEMERKIQSGIRKTSIAEKEKTPLAEMGNKIQELTQFELERLGKPKIIPDMEKIHPVFEKRERSVEDGYYFRSLLELQRERLQNLIAQADHELERGNELPEEAGGKFRVASGRARLIMERKFKQFEDLCRKNVERKPGEVFPVTNEDLAGYWDAVMIQVDQIGDIFEQGFDILKYSLKVNVLIDN